MYKTNLIFLVSILFSISLASQTVVKGKIRDESGILKQAHIITFDTVSNRIVKFTTSDNKGTYALILEKQKYYELRVSFLGYRTAKTPIFTADSDTITKDILLQAKNLELEEVEIVYTMPIKVHGDTVTYDAESFSTGNERKLQDVLSNLPGVEMMKNGDVKVKGKKVKKIMIDDKDFFDGDTKLATKNIPANVIDKVQVLNNYSEVGMMKGVAPDDDPVINIKLKKGKKRFWFGDIEAGLGVEDKFLIHPKLFYYSPKTSINFIGNMNNAGKEAMSFKDYVRFSGGMSSVLGSSGNFEDQSYLYLRNEKAKQINPKFAALNINHNPNKKMTISGFAIFNTNQIQTLQKDDKDYFVSHQQETTETKSDIQSQFALYKIRLNYQPNTRWYINYNVFGKVSESSLENDLQSDLLGNIGTGKENKTNAVNQNFQVYFSPSEKGILSLNLHHSYAFNNSNIDFTASQNPFAQLPFANSPNFHFSQYNELESTRFQGDIEYVYLLNKQNNIRFRVGNQFENNLLSLKTKQNTETQEIWFGEESNLQNQLTDQLKYYFSTLMYKVLLGKFTAMIGAKGHLVYTNTEQLETPFSEHNFYASPDFYLKYQILQSQDITFTYSMSPQFVGTKMKSEAYRFSAYNSMIFGNQKLSPSLNHQLSLFYSHFNSFAFSNTHAFVNYSRQVSPIGSNSQFIDNSYLLLYQQIYKPQESAFAHINYDKKVSKLRLNLSSQWRWTKAENSINELLIQTQSFSQNYEISASSFFKNKPNIEFGTSYGRNNFFQNEVKSTYSDIRFFTNFEIPFWKQFVFIADYSYEVKRNHQSKINNYYSFLSADLYYKTKNESWEFSLSARNLLNNQSIREINETELFLYTSDYYVMPRSVLFSAVYKL